MRLLTIISLLILPATSYAQESGKELFLKAVAEMKQHKSLSYKATSRIKYAHTNDTATHNGEVHMLRNERDTMMGGMVWQGEEDNSKYYSFYDMDMRYIVMHPQRKVWREKMDHNDMGLRSHNYRLLFETFLKPENLLKYQFTEINTLSDTVIAGQACYRIATKLSSGFDNVGDIEQTWFFSKKDIFPILTITSTRIDDGMQYDERYFTMCEYDKVDIEKFSLKQIPADYLVDARKSDIVIDNREKK